MHSGKCIIREMLFQKVKNKDVDDDDVIFKSTSGFDCLSVTETSETQSSVCHKHIAKRPIVQKEAEPFKSSS